MTTKEDTQPQEVVEPEGLQVPVVTETPAVEGSGSNCQTGEGTPPKGEAPAKTFTQEDIERIRKEEKDKLYKTLEEMKGQLATVTQERAEREKAAKEAEKAAAAEAKKRAEEELSAKELLAQKEQEWEHRFQTIEQDRARTDALLERERQYTQLQEYRTRRLTEEAEHIMPELIDYVTGMSEDEIEQAIASAREKTARIVGNIQQATQQQRQSARGASVTSPPVGPMEQNNEGYETMTADDIRGMDMATYAKNRERLIKAASNNRRGGLFQ